MTDSDTNRENRRGERAAQIGLAVRLGMLAWDIVWTLVREHVFLGTGPERPL